MRAKGLKKGIKKQQVRIAYYFIAVKYGKHCFPLCPNVKIRQQTIQSL